MKNRKLVLALLSLGLIQLPLVLAGCQAQQIGNKAGDEFNPAMSPKMKQAQMKHRANDAP